MRASPRTSPPSRPLTRPSFLQRRALKSGAVAFPHSDPRSALPVSSDDPERPALRRGHLARPRPLATPAEVAAGSCPAARCSGPGTAVPSPRPVPWVSLSRADSPPRARSAWRRRRGRSRSQSGGRKAGQASVPVGHSDALSRVSVRGLVRRRGGSRASTVSDRPTADICWLALSLPISGTCPGAGTEFQTYSRGWGAPLSWWHCPLHSPPSTVACGPLYVTSNA